MGGAKVELLLQGQTLLQRVVAVFLARVDVRQIVIALSAERVAQPPSWLHNPRIRLVAGGAERTDSVRAGLQALDADIETVVIHDAARPLVSADLIERVIALARTGVSTSYKRRRGRSCGRRRHPRPSLVLFWMLPTDRGPMRRLWPLMMLHW
jgi:2-C-methyl-D-erythritol 4-phosphate cytidylyltransferase